MCKSNWAEDLTLAVDVLTGRNSTSPQSPVARVY